MSLPFPDTRTPEQRAADHQRWINGHYLEEGRAYTYEVRKIWWDGWNWLGFKRMRWTAYIKQATCPWMGVCSSPNFRTRWGAMRWARAYLKRGGPPEGYFDPRLDPRARVYTKRKPKGAGIVGPDWP